MVSRQWLSNCQLISLEALPSLQKAVQANGFTMMYSSSLISLLFFFFFQFSLSEIINLKTDFLHNWFTTFFFLNRLQSTQSGPSQRKSLSLNIWYKGGLRDQITTQLARDKLFLFFNNSLANSLVDVIKYSVWT